MRPRRVILFFLLIGLIVLPTVCYARSSTIIKAEAGLAMAWDSFYAGDYEKAYKMADAISAVKIDVIKAESVHIQGRCAWAMNTKKSQAAAVKLWATLPKMSDSSANLSRIDIDAALQGEAAQKLDEAAAKLEGVLRQQASETSTAEAAIEYAGICGLQKQWTKGHAALDFAIKFMQMQAKYGEISQVAAEPFIKAAQAMKLKLEAMKNHQPGKEEYEAAMKLFNAGKFKDAAESFQKIAKLYPDSPYRYMSELAIGDCIAAVNGTKAAVKYWEGWIKSSPGGPWRGQAYLRVIDEYLVNRLDLESARKYSNLAGANLKNANVSKEESWKQAAFDISFRCGMIEYLLNNVSGASSWFADCSKLTTDTTKIKEISEFAELTKSCNNSSIVPAETCETKDPRVVVALKLAEMYRRAGQLEKSDLLLSRLIGGGSTEKKTSYLTKATAQQKSYAMFCRARILKTQAKNDDAEKCYKYSLEKFREGSWQDESMWQLALGIKTRAEVLKDKKLNPQPQTQPAKPEPKKEKLAKESPKKDKSKLVAQAAKKPEPKKLLTLDDIKKQEQLADAAENTYAGVLSAGGPYWEEIVKRYPKGQFAGPSLYELGTLEILKGKYKAAMFTMMKMAVEYPQTPQAPKGLDELGTAMLTAGLTKDGTYILEELVKMYPKDLVCGDAYLKLIDLQIEEYYDFVKARQYAIKGVVWVDSLKLNPQKIREEIDAKQKAYVPKEGDTWSTEKPKDPTLLLCYTLYTRAGLVEYLADNKKEALRLFNEAIDYDQGMGWRPGRPSLLHGRLIAKANGGGEKVTPDGLEKFFTNDKQKFLTRLADMYMLIQIPEKGNELYSKLIENKEKLGQYGPGLEAYFIMRYSQTLKFTEKHDAAIAHMRRLFAEQYRNYPWTGMGLLFAGTWVNNEEQNNKNALPYWRYVLRYFPDTEYGQQALYFYGLTYDWAKKYDKALQAYKLYVKKYPNTYWEKGIKERLVQIERDKNAKNNKR